MNEKFFQCLPKKEEKEPEKPKIEKKEEIKIPEIMELLLPTEEIIKELRTNIEKGEYKYIIGDDASGRIPALVLYNFIKKVNTDNNFEIPKIYFIAGSRGLKKKELNIKKSKLEEHLAPLLDYKNEPISYLNKLKNKINNSQQVKKVLVVTDTICTGESIKPITTILKKHGLDFDIATIGFLGGPQSQKEKYLGGKITFGQFGEPDIYRAKTTGVNGVEKEPINVLSTAIYNKRRAVKNSREDVKVLSDNLYTWYKNKYKESK